MLFILQKFEKFKVKRLNIYKKTYLQLKGASLTYPHLKQHIVLNVVADWLREKEKKNKVKMRDEPPDDMAISS